MAHARGPPLAQCKAQSDAGLANPWAPTTSLTPDTGPRKLPALKAPQSSPVTKVSRVQLKVSRVVEGVATEFTVKVREGTRQGSR